MNVERERSRARLQCGVWHRVWIMNKYPAFGSRDDAYRITLARALSSQSHSSHRPIDYHESVFVPDGSCVKFMGPTFPSAQSINVSEVLLAHSGSCPRHIITIIGQGDARHGWWWRDMGRARSSSHLICINTNLPESSFSFVSFFVVRFQINRRTTNTNPIDTSR